jgi:hypothetical protein
MTKSTITFAAIDNGVTEEEIATARDEVLAVPDDMWHFNEFRGTYMLPVYNTGGVVGKVNKAEGNMSFTPAADLCPTLKYIILEKIFPWMDPVGRCAILRTPAGYGLNPHFDANENEINTRQDKYRLALKGKLDSLHFLDQNRNKVHIPTHYKSYIMDGGHIHSLDPADEEKVTLCIGAPWTGNPTPEYQAMLDNSPYKLKVKQPEEFEEEWLDSFWRK